MHYYRFRPFSEISLKELLYSEIYFSSPEECNDPFDSKTFYCFSDDKPKWIKIVQLLCERHKIPLSVKLYDSLADHLCKQCPMTFDEAMKKELLKGFSSGLPENNLAIDFLSRCIQDFLKVYRPATRYFVSFSRTNSELLMWSHYADKHKGFCLIFKSIEGKLKLAPHNRKKKINKSTPNGLALQMTFDLPEDFSFIDIDYLPEVSALDAFIHMPAYVSGDVDDEVKKQELVAQRESHYQQKGKNWIYEDESRLVLSPPPAWLFGQHFEYSKQERLFHYEPSQLVGIIYGARMPEEDRLRVRQILKDRENWNESVSSYDKIVFNFLEFEAKLSINQRNLEIEPISISHYKPILKSDKDFDRLYNDWKEGIGWERANGHSKRMKVK